ncbi:MAG: HAD-IA family hydrolase [Methylococcales bacterium]|nr:HAD-IA family hydrolase [Methylococcales bacterium]
MFELKCVLFDLDGTLVDTAPDLIASLNYALTHHGFNPVEAYKVRPYISYGAVAMINKANVDANEEIKANILETLLNYYQANILHHGGLFDGMGATLALIEEKGLKWGVITNKQQRLSVPLMEALALTDRAACLISGDSCNHSKPHPEPMLTACTHAAVNPKDCVYIGDAKHDMIAGRAVNMKTLAAIYGYLTVDDKPETWQADALVQSPKQINEWINKALCC